MYSLGLVQAKREVVTLEKNIDCGILHKENFLPVLSILIQNTNVLLVLLASRLAFTSQTLSHTPLRLNLKKVSEEILPFTSSYVHVSSSHILCFHLLIFLYLFCILKAHCMWAMEQLMLACVWSVSRKEIEQKRDWSEQKRYWSYCQWSTVTLNAVMINIFPSWYLNSLSDIWSRILDSKIGQKINRSDCNWATVTLMLLINRVQAPAKASLNQPVQLGLFSPHLP